MNIYCRWIDISICNRNNEVIETQTNDDQGNIYFNTLNFNQEGHYVYYIQEHINDNDPFVEYDQSIYQVNIDVSRNGNNLQAKVEYLLDDKQVDDVTFNNIYHPLSLTVQKRSKDLSKDPFDHHKLIDKKFYHFSDTLWSRRTR